MYSKSSFRNLFYGILIASFFISSPSYANNRIINGQAATITDYPWMASLFVMSNPETGEGGSCGGTLIHPEWVLTAAHCFLNTSGDAVDTSTASQTTVTLSSTTLEPLESSAVIATGASVIIHPGYNPNFDTSDNVNDNDMALLKLSAPVSGITPITLIEGSTSDIADGTTSTVMGWGATAIDSQGQSVNASNSLLKVDQKVVSNSSCSDIYSFGITDNMLCAGGLTASDSSDSCQGDSGGPLVVQNGSSITQIGVVSFGGVNESCGEAGVPGVYAKISRYQSFIQQNIPSGVTFTALGSTGTDTGSTGGTDTGSTGGTDTTGTTGSCPGAVLDSELNLSIPCLIYEGVAYTTDLFMDDPDSLVWVWSGELSPSVCEADTNSCTTVNSALELTVRKVSIGGVDYTAILQYNPEFSQGGDLFWNYLKHTAD